MLLIKDLGMKLPKETSKQKKRIGLYECSCCKKHFEAITSDVKRRSQTRCKQCTGIKYFSKEEVKKAKKEAVKKFRQTKKGLICKVYGQQKASSAQREMPPPSYTKKEFEDWAFNQKEFHNLFELWVLSEYETNLIPSFDRLDDCKPYSFENLQILTWVENKTKHEQQLARGEKIHKSNPQRAVIKCDKDGNEIQEYFSLMQAERETGVNASNIHNVCNKKYGFNTAGGFKWKFKE